MRNYLANPKVCGSTVCCLGLDITAGLAQIGIPILGKRAAAHLHAATVCSQHTQSVPLAGIGLVDSNMCYSNYLKADSDREAHHDMTQAPAVLLAMSINGFASGNCKLSSHFQETPAHRTWPTTPREHGPKTA